MLEVALPWLDGVVRAKRPEHLPVVLTRDETTLKVEIEQEDDGRWLAEVVELPGVLAYGESQPAALSRVQALALCWRLS